MVHITSYLWGFETTNIMLPKTNGIFFYLLEHKKSDFQLKGDKKETCEVPPGINW